MLERLDLSKWSAGGVLKKSEFKARMLEILQSGVYTSQELFVIVHAVLYGKNKEDIGSMIIYWEPHELQRRILEKCVLWLDAAECPCDIINVVRNECIVRGGWVKAVLDMKVRATRSSYWFATYFHDTHREKYINSKRITSRFEDLKTNPGEELHKLCKEMGIPLMEVTHYGEKYFSEFDRFRISLICALWQEKYGYPYTDILLFSRKEVQEMF